MASFLTIGGAVAAQEATISDEPPLPVADYAADAIVLDEIVADLANIEQRPWEALVVHPDGRTFDVYFTDSDPDCTRLHDVEVASQPSGLEVVVLTGEPPDMVMCNERGGVFYVVTIDADRALMGGGVDSVPR